MGEGVILGVGLKWRGCGSHLLQCRGGVGWEGTEPRLNVWDRGDRVAPALREGWGLGSAQTGAAVPRFTGRSPLWRGGTCGTVRM